MSLKSTLSVILLVVALALGLAALGRSRSVGRQTSFAARTSQEHTAWVGESLRRMQSIKAGMTRADLLKVFTTEGGISTRLRRTYVYPECPYFKVDVEFEPAGRPARDAAGRVPLEESGEDVIKSVSRPYIDWGVAD